MRSGLLHKILPWALRVSLLAAAATGAVGAAPSAPAAPLQWTTPAVEAPRVAHHSFESRAARTRVSHHLSTPAAYARDPERRFPVVYWLHGSGGGVQGIPQLARLVDGAIEAGRVPPFLVVFVNGLRLGMYVDWKDGRAPLETMIVKELVPHIDATFRTVAKREGRRLDGFSMGGYGAARFGFKYPEMFLAVSIMGAGPLQETLDRTPPTTPPSSPGILWFAWSSARATRTWATTSRSTTISSASASRTTGSSSRASAMIRCAFLQTLGDRHWAFYRKAFD